MRVLLPPSESKRPDGGNAIFEAHALHFQASLGATRERVRDALTTVSADRELAIRALKLGNKAEPERLHNLRFAEASGLPAIERYVGVLYDEIAINELSSQAYTWITEQVLVQSALFGLITAGDHIPPYRLSATSRLTAELGATLTRTWNAAFKEFEWPRAFVLDLRSKDYAALAPLTGHTNWVTLDVVQRTEDGGVRALNHFNKRAKGDLVKRLAQSEAQVNSVHELIAWAEHEGLEIRAHADEHRATLVTELGAVNRAERVA